MRGHLGWTLLTYTWPQVTDEAERVLAEIAATYRRLSASAAGRLA